MEYLYNNESNDLAHYGILGMKWGVRKDGKPQGFQYGKTVKRAKAVKNKTMRKATGLNRSERKAIRKVRREKTVASRKRVLLSDAELNQRIARLEKEKRLRELTEEDLHRGRKAAKDTVRVTGKKIAIGAGTVLGTAIVTSALSGHPEVAEEIWKRVH